MDEYKSPKSNLTAENTENIKQNTALKIIVFILLTVIGLFGLWVSGCGLLLISFSSGMGVALLFVGIGVLFLTARGIKTVFSNNINTTKNLKTFLWTAIVILVLGFLFLFGML